MTARNPGAAAPDELRHRRPAAFPAFSVPRTTTRPKQPLSTGDRGQPVIESPPARVSMTTWYVVPLFAAAIGTTVTALPPAGTVVAM